MNKGGRPSKYIEEFASHAQKLCEFGATDEDLADFFGVTIRTIYNWSAKHSEFLQALKAGKASSDERVERSLYQRAVGYTFDSEVVRVLRDGTVVRVPTREHVPPDTTAMIFWLKNRRPENWRDKSEINVRHTVEHMTDDELERIAAGRGEGVDQTPIDPAKLN